MKEVVILLIESPALDVGLRYNVSTSIIPATNNPPVLVTKEQGDMPVFCRMEGLATSKLDRLCTFYDFDELTRIIALGAQNRDTVRPVTQGSPTQCECHAPCPANEWRI